MCGMPPRNRRPLANLEWNAATGGNSCWRFVSGAALVPKAQDCSFGSRFATRLLILRIGAVSTLDLGSCIQCHCPLLATKKGQAKSPKGGLPIS